jgi:ribonuclease HII
LSKIASLLPFFKPNCVEAGLDEAGRGCLAGPVVAAAVILPPDYSNSLLNDSKKLSHKQRAELRIVIEKEALAWEVSFVDNEEIDRVNILNASFLAMNRAVQQLKTQPEHLIVDGNRFRPQPYNTIPFTCIVKGDGKFLSIAAASILAKTHRDEYMEKLHLEFPHYDWNGNKGYPTPKHRDGIREQGITSFHRKSFTLLNDQVELFEK